MIKEELTFDNDDELINVDAESTFLNPSITTKEQLIDWVLSMLGAPLITVELNETHLNTCIANALTLYTKYAYFEEQYIPVQLDEYIPGKGLPLKKYNILSIKDISFARDNILGLSNMDTFFGPQAWFMSTGGYPFFGGNAGNFSGSFTTYHNLHEFFDLTKRMTGSIPDWTYDRVTKMLRIMPEPRRGEINGKYVLLNAQCEPPVEVLYGNEYVRRLVLAYAKIILGTIRKKFGNVNMTGGAQVDTTIGDEGREELKEITENIIRDESRGQSYFIA